MSNKRRVFDYRLFCAWRNLEHRNELPISKWIELSSSLPCQIVEDLAEFTTMAEYSTCGIRITDSIEANIEITNTLNQILNLESK